MFVSDPFSSVPTSHTEGAAGLDATKSKSKDDSNFHELHIRKESRSRAPGSLENTKLNSRALATTPAALDLDVISNQKNRWLLGSINIRLAQAFIPLAL